MPDNTDCDDVVGDVNPDATEVVNGVDDDCDGKLAVVELDCDNDGSYPVALNTPLTDHGDVGLEDCATAEPPEKLTIRCFDGIDINVTCDVDTGLWTVSMDKLGTLVSADDKPIVNGASRFGQRDVCSVGGVDCNDYCDLECECGESSFEGGIPVDPGECSAPMDTDDTDTDSEEPDAEDTAASEKDPEGGCSCASTPASGIWLTLLAVVGLSRRSPSAP